MTRYGYVRKDYPISTVEQLTNIMPYKCDELFIEEAKFEQEIELNQLLKKMNQKDQLIVYNFQVFGKNLKAFKQLVIELQKKKIRLISVEDEIDTETIVSFYKSALTIIKMFENNQGHLVRKSLERVKQSGSMTGRPAISDEVIKRILYLYKQGKPMREIASICGVSLGTVYKYVEKGRKR